LLLDLRGTASFADYFVLCSSDSPPQTAAIMDEIERTLRARGVRLHHREGAADSGWVLLDYGDLVVHIFTPEQRAFYDLESAWAKAPQLVRVP
jgi:ribosome-associated protein